MEDPRYVEVWRRRRRVGWAAAVLAVPGLLAFVGGIAAQVLWRSGGSAIAVGFGLLAVGAGGFGNWYFMMKCPRCQQAFGYRPGALLSLRRRECVHCGLPFGAVADPDGATESAIATAQRSAQDDRAELERLMLRVIPVMLPVWAIGWFGITAALHAMGRVPLGPPVTVGVFGLLWLGGGWLWLRRRQGGDGR